MALVTTIPGLSIDVCFVWIQCIYQNGTLCSMWYVIAYFIAQSKKIHCYTMFSQLNTQVFSFSVYCRGDVKTKMGILSRWAFVDYRCSMTGEHLLNKWHPTPQQWHIVEAEV